MTFEAIGAPTFNPTPSEEVLLKNRRSLYVVAPIKKGERFTKHNVRSIRPGLGMQPKFFDHVMTHFAGRDIAYGEPLSSDMLASGSESHK